MERLKLKVKGMVEKEFDVEFPIYRQHDVSPDDGPSIIIYTRIDKSLRMESITVCSDGRYEIETKERYEFDDSCPDYHLGRGLYASSAEKFETALEEMKQRIRNMGPRK